MLAVVTSTVKPESGIKAKKSFYSYSERLEQTKVTLSSLYNSGFDTIYLVDNSPGLNEGQLQELFSDFSGVKICHIQQYQFINKGINELLMLLLLCNHLPQDQSIFKISGRYYPSVLFKKPEFADLAVKGDNFTQKKGTISTRAYWVKNKSILEQFLLQCINEVFAYPERIVGMKSLYNKLNQWIFNKHALPINISIEFAAAKVLKRYKYKITMVDNLGIEGLVAGSNHKEKIIE